MGDNEKVDDQAARSSSKGKKYIVLAILIFIVAILISSAIMLYYYKGSVGVSGGNAVGPHESGVARKANRYSSLSNKKGNSGRVSYASDGQADAAKGSQKKKDGVTAAKASSGQKATDKPSSDASTTAKKPSPQRGSISQQRSGSADSKSVEQKASKSSLIGNDDYDNVMTGYLSEVDATGGAALRGSV